MRWSEPQLAMLREMGLRLWLAPDTVVATAAAAATASVSAPAPAPAPAPASASAPADFNPLPDAAAAAVAAAAVAAVAPGSGSTAAPAAPPPPDRARPARLPAAAAAAPAASPVASAPLIDAAGLDWPALRDAVVGCRACSLCETRRQTVFGVGHRRAHCMIVGEAPGETEDARGEPFVGESGQLLDRMLRAIGLGRLPADPADPDHAADPARQVYIANALKCRPPRNRNPTAQELATCQPYLERQVALVQPRVIIAMGRFAVQSLLGSDEPIGQLRGRVHRWRGVPLVVTYHPAYLLRQPAEKARAWDDLCLAAACLDSAAG